MAHVHDKIDFTAEVFIVHNNRVLLRVHDKRKIWLSVGGHIELDEDPNEAAMREVKEEVGLDIVLWNGNQRFACEVSGYKELIPPVAINRHRVSATHEHVTMVYFASSSTDAVFPEYEDDRSDEWGWFSKDELGALQLEPNVRFYAELALDTLGTT